ncbi:hypothetical protein GMSM_20580 [Geomonas sp. Red276]
MSGMPTPLQMVISRSAWRMVAFSFSITQGPATSTSGFPPPIFTPPTATSLVIQFPCKRQQSPPERVRHVLMKPTAGRKGGQAPFRSRSP